MENTYNLNNIETVMQDEAVLEALAKATAKEEVKTILAGRGIELNDAEAQDILTGIRKVAESGELDEEMLDAVAGGFGGMVMFACGCITFYITVKVGFWIVNKILK